VKNAERTNYALRETLRREKAKNPGGTTAVSTCGANPGMVSWFVKQALVDLANETGLSFEEPSADDREGWAKLMKKVGVKGIHIAERDTQRTKNPKPLDVFWNTWSVEGFIAEGLQPAELGWGTHEELDAEERQEAQEGLPGGDLPRAARRQHTRTLLVPDARPAIRLPRHPQRVDLDRRLLHGARQGRRGELPPDLPLRLPSRQRRRALAARDVRQWRQTAAVQHVLDENELVDGIDELGVLLYGHEKNAYWYGSRLSLEETRRIAPYQNATGLQVTSAVLAGMVWALENPKAGIVEADEVDYKRCLEVQRPYLGPVEGHYTTGRRSRAARASSRRTSTPPIPGSSATFWFADRCLCRGEAVVSPLPC
jgi:homospermidine synthase